MSDDAHYLCFLFFLSAPFLAIVSILAYYVLRRAAWRQGKRLGWKSLGYYPSSFALGMALQFIQVFHRPSMAYVLEARQNEDAEEDDAGDPENLKKQLHRQLRRIRRGEHVERLVLRL
ncbi:MAG: hypothetical protein P4K86_07025 [Terracidiphilus sp.]|nr:hypothetical protein [Terracidiphilus sp.]MDR3775905.1 hypothetical protein [Terracidiphilus sp.]